MTPSGSFFDISAALARAVHAGPRQLVLVATGGGSLAFPALLAVPGASRCILEMVVPYSAASLTAWLGARPEHFCSEPTARQMAMAGYQRARRLVAAESPAPSVAGVAVTASLASDRPKRGGHRIHAAAQTNTHTISSSWELAKGKRNRDQEEELAARLVLNLAAEACEAHERLPLDLLVGERLESFVTHAPLPWQQLVAGTVQQVAARGAADSPAQRRAVFPGAFHPRHHGHVAMADLASARLGVPVEFEISIENVDKPLLDFREMELRAAQFAAGETLWFTRAATFVEKAALFPGATFLVGADTIVRIADPRYYGQDAGVCRAAIASIAARGCRFLVFGRRVGGGFQALAELDLPRELAVLCEGVPAESFRADVSSTDIRAVADD